MAKEQTDRANLYDAIARRYESGETKAAYPWTFFEFKPWDTARHLREAADRIRRMHADKMQPNR